ncbi:Protein of unknown function [Pyronema omphalodes CBS 100304]|uniref:Uncharacterized protein n=1 Tax=Pyronema omphalodes (strain CBS 100304) TaxID=1076935 RepID=U4LV58_PYROM|nr:Protein of unknown function [Pyronema omphalodes CBS 100304]
MSPKRAEDGASGMSSKRAEEAAVEDEMIRRVHEAAEGCTEQFSNPSISTSATAQTAHQPVIWQPTHPTSDHVKHTGQANALQLARGPKKEEEGRGRGRGRKGRGRGRKEEHPTGPSRTELPLSSSSSSSSSSCHAAALSATSSPRCTEGVVGLASASASASAVASASAASSASAAAAACLFCHR